MIVPVIECDIEDGALVGQRDLPHIAGTQMRRTEKINVVQYAWRAKISARKRRQALHRYPHTISSIKTLAGKCRQPIGQIEILRVRGLDAAHEQALGVDHFDSANLGVFIPGRNFLDFDGELFQWDGNVRH